jgi:hypothetical protein
MIAEHHPETNYYVPSSLPLFSLLEAAEDRVNLTKHISQHEPTYVPYAVKVYYAIMYYIQILRARRDSGTIEGYENTLLKRFEVKFPMQSLPCAQIVFGYYNTIIATELAEAKYDWIAPYIAIENLAPAQPRRTTAYGDISITNGATHLQPPIPHMIAILNTFIHHSPTTIANHMIGGDTYHPVIIDNTAGTANNIFNKGMMSDRNQELNLKVLMASTGLNTPMVFGNDNFETARRHAKRTDFGRDINVVVNNASVAGARAGLTHAFSYADLDDFLMMPKTSNLRSFGYLRDQAVIHARFFDKVYHFSDVQTTGGLETTVLAQLKVAVPGTNDHHYPDVNIGIRDDFAWYNNPLRTLRSGFATNRAGLRRNEELQAFAYGTNAILPMIVPNDLKTGVFWSNYEWIQTLYFDTTNQGAPDTAHLTAAGKPMYMDHNSMVLRCFREKPHGTGIVDNEFD